MDQRQTRVLALVALLGSLSVLACLLFLPATFPSLLQVIWNWLALVALTLWGGGLVVEQLVARAHQDTSPFFDTASARLRSLQETCLWFLLISEVVSFALRAARFLHPLSGQNLPLAMLLRSGGMTTDGRVWLVRAVLILFALVCQRGRQRVPRQGKSGTRLVRTGAGSLHAQTAHARSVPGWSRGCFGWARAAAHLVSHVLVPASLIQFLLLGGITLTYAATGTVLPFPSLYLSAVAMNWLTLIAQCLWFGGLACLGAVLLPDMESDWDDSLVALIETVRRATPWIGSAIGVTLVSTLFLSEARIRGAASGATILLSDPTGQALLVKWILLMLLVIVSLNALLMPPVKMQQRAVSGETSPDKQVVLEQAERNLRRPTRLFLAGAAALLLCSVLMSFFASPTLLSQTAGTLPMPAVWAGQAGNVSLPCSIGLYGSFHGINAGEK